MSAVGVRRGKAALFQWVPRLAKEMVLDSSTLTRSIGPLEREGPVERSAVKDRGRISLSVTGKGRDGLARALRQPPVQL